MARSFDKPARVFAVILAIIFAFSLFGCTTTVAGKPVVVRIGHRIPGIITQMPDGEAQYSLRYKPPTTNGC